MSHVRLAKTAPWAFPAPSQGPLNVRRVLQGMLPWKWQVKNVRRVPKVGQHMSPLTPPLVLCALQEPLQISRIVGV